MKILNIVLSIMFILFALVQYNDPDPYIWAPIYLFVAGVCGAAAFNRYNNRVTLAGTIILTIYALFYVPDFIDWVKMGMPSIVETMKAEKLYVELTREFGGLVVCLVVLLWQLKRGKKVTTSN
jgi:TctA family transporter